MQDSWSDMKQISEDKVMDRYGKKYKIEPLKSWELPPSFIIFAFTSLISLILGQEPQIPYEPDLKPPTAPLIIDDLSHEPLKF